MVVQKYRSLVLRSAARRIGEYRYCDDGKKRFDDDAPAGLTGVYSTQLDYSRL